MRLCCATCLLVGALAVRADEVETIVVTGTHVATPDYGGASPTVVVPAEMFQQTSAVSVERTLNELPQFVPDATATANSPSNDGAANISLRGLGPARTLVLLDGRRLVSGDGRNAVDINVLPPALIEQVDVVTGGASAVYGSDAVAGVVNFRLRRGFDGVKLDAGWARSGHGDGEEYSAGVTAGAHFADTRGSVMGYVGYTDRAQIDQDDRSFSKYPLQYFASATGGEFLPSGSGSVEEGVEIVFADQTTFDQVFAGYGYPTGTVPYTPGLALNADGSVFAIGDGSPNSVANYRGVPDPVFFNGRNYDVYNFAPATALQMPLDRTTAFARGNFEFSQHADLYVQFLGADYSVDRQLAPVEAAIALVPPTNPHISADLATLLAARANPDAPFRFFKRLTEIGPQTATNSRDVWQATTGLRGTLTERWSYDAYLQYGRNDRKEQQTGNIRLSRFQDLTFAADAGAAICGDFNPFVKYSLSSACIAYVSADATNRITVEQRTAELSLTGPMWSLPAGDVRAAIGTFYNKAQFDFDADPLLSAMLPGVPGVIGPRPDLAGFEAASDRSGYENDTDVYVELLIPVLADLPLADSLDIAVGYRHADFHHAGDVDSYKAEFSYQPAAPARLRGSYQHTVRSPSVDELFYPPVANTFMIVAPDPCSASSAARNGPDRAAVETLCLAQGLPAPLLANFEYPLRRVDGISGGNPNLAPEKADTYTFGVVLTPTFAADALGDLEVAIDWYRIELDDGIGRWDAESAVARCFDPAYNPDYRSDNVYCSFFERDAETGQIFALLVDRNIGGIRTSGIDTQIGWSIGAGSGTLHVNENLGYLHEWEYVDPGGGTIDYVGTVGGEGLGRSLPKWKSLLNVDYRWASLTVFAKWQHIESMNDVVYRGFSVPARNYFGCSARYEIHSGRLDGFIVRVGVENLFDEDPPIFPSWQQANTDPSQYDVLGRRYFVNASYRL